MDSRPLALTIMNDLQAREFAANWIDAWNSHDLNRIMEHYDSEVVLISPVAARIMCDPSVGDPAGTITGAPRLRAYFAKGLEFYPQLEFRLLETFCGLNSVVLYYTNQNRTGTAEFMEFGPNGKVSRVVANYTEPGVSAPHRLS